MRGIERLPSGKYRCTLRRTQGTEKKKPADSRAGSYEAALAVRDEVEAMDRENVPGPGGLTVRQWSRIWLDDLAKAKATGRKRLSRKKQNKLVKSEKLDIDTIRSHFNAHILRSDLADMAVRVVKPRHIEQFLTWLRSRPRMQPGTVKGGVIPAKDGKTISERTQQHIFTSLGNMFFAAKMDVEKRCGSRIDPTVGLQVLTTDQDHDDPDRWLDDDRPLTLAERTKLFDDFGDDPERWIVEAAYGTGARQGEFWNLELRDVHLDDAEPHIWIRWGSPGLPPKNGQARKVPLVGVGLRAMQKWMAALKDYAPVNSEGLVFPMKERITKTGKRMGGTRRLESSVPASFERRQKAEVLGPGRKFNWHALRHSCATSLLCGEEGDPWDLTAISKLLGHKSLAVTQMYAKFRPQLLFSTSRKYQQSFEERQAKLAPALPPAQVPDPTPAPAAVPSPLPALSPAAVQAPVAMPAALVVAPTPASTVVNPGVDLAAVIALGVQEALKAFGLTGVTSAGVPAPTPVAPVALALPVEGPSAAVPPHHSEPPAPPPKTTLVTPARSMRKGTANRRARPTVASSGDTEGPRRSSDALTQLIDPLPLAGLHSGSFTPTAGSLDGLIVAATVPSVRTRAKLEARTPAVEKGTPWVSPSDEPTTAATREVTPAASPALDAASGAEGTAGVYPERLISEPVLTHGPRSVHEVSTEGPHTNDYNELDTNPFGLRNRRSKVRILPGAQQYQTLTAIRPAGVDTAWTLDEADRGSPGEMLETPSTACFEELTQEPAWFAALQALGSDPATDDLQGASSEELAPPLVSPPAPPPPAVETAPVPSQRHRDKTPEHPVDPSPLPPPDAPPSTATALAQKVMRYAAAGRQDTRRAAEDLASHVLLSRAESRHHEAARLVLQDAESNPDLTIPHGLQLAAQVIGGGIRKGRKPKGRKPTT